MNPSKEEYMGAQAFYLFSIQHVKSGDARVEIAKAWECFRRMYGGVTINVTPRRETMKQISRELGEASCAG